MDRNSPSSFNEPKGRILVVDDESSARKPICLSLLKAGYEVLEAENGAQAIRALDSTGQAPAVDTILCDLMMPQFDGALTISYFRRHHPFVPIIILTGAPDPLLPKVLLNHGATDYLLKPVSGKTLLRTIRLNVALHALRRKDATH